MALPRKGAKKTPRQVKCRWCKWSAPVIAIGKSGGGWRRLWEHARVNHPERVEQIEAWAKRRQ